MRRRFDEVADSDQKTSACLRIIIILAVSLRCLIESLKSDKKKEKIEKCRKLLMRPLSNQTLI